jgi:hypothetical protein
MDAGKCGPAHLPESRLFAWSVCPRLACSLILKEERWCPRTESKSINPWGFHGDFVADAFTNAHIWPKKSLAASSIDANKDACLHRGMPNLTPIECLFIWLTKSLRLQLALVLWLAGLRRIELPHVYRIPTQRG